MSGNNDDTQQYVDQIKQGWSQLSAGVVDQVKKYTGMEGGEGSGVNILPANLMSMSSEDKADTSKVEESVGKKEDFAKDPLGLGESAEKPKGKRITEANKEYAGKVAEAQKYATGGGKASAEDPLGLGLGSGK